MRKSLIDQHPIHAGRDTELGWLDIQELAAVEVTSEDANFPIESVFTSENQRGWRAAWQGEQVIRLIFDEPRTLHRIRLRFSETEINRTQEFTLRWSSGEGQMFKEIVRQQWNFSAGSSTNEVEDYIVNLNCVSVLELVIKPEITCGAAIATLASWQVA